MTQMTDSDADLGNSTDQQGLMSVFLGAARMTPPASGTTLCNLRGPVFQFARFRRFGVMTRRKRPDGLGLAGAALWRSVLAVYELSPAEAATLERACRTMDLMARIDAELAAGPVTTEGSMGQLKANPLIAAQADLARVLNVQMMSLALPMPDETAGRRRSPQQREAAQQRWRGQRGDLEA